MSKKSFSVVFNEALDAITSEALLLDVPMAELCSDAGISRATPSRWKRRPPRTVQTVVKLEAALAKRRGDS
jgi:hypothetical protein